MYFMKTSHLEKEKKYFKERFKAAEYLKNYYAHIDAAMVQRYVVQKTAASETARIMIHMAEVAVPEIKSVFGDRKPTVLELGGGPTLYQLFSIADTVKEIHFTDYTEDNLREVRKWVHREGGGFSMVCVCPSRANAEERFSHGDEGRGTKTRDFTSG